MFNVTKAFHLILVSTSIESFSKMKSWRIQILISLSAESYAPLNHNTSSLRHKLDNEWERTSKQRFDPCRYISNSVDYFKQFNDGKLKKGAIIVITDFFNVFRIIIGRLWKHANKLVEDESNFMDNSLQKNCEQKGKIDMNDIAGVPLG